MGSLLHRDCPGLQHRSYSNKAWIYFFVSFGSGYPVKLLRVLMLCGQSSGFKKIMYVIFLLQAKEFERSAADKDKPKKKKKQ